jgi:ABC-2 type transport system ATP-binding protein
MLAITHFKKSYNSHLVIQVDELIIHEGIHWFRGINGSGKSTFFKSVAGLLPFEGTVVLENQYDIRKNPVEYRLRVNYAEAEPIYPDYLTGKDLIDFIADAKKSSKVQVEKLISALQINDFVGNQVGTYSSGMLKKLSLVLAFLGNPKIIMLDEPLVTIDTQAVTNMYALIKEYRSEGVTFLLSSHQDFKFEELQIDKTYLVQNQTVTELSNEKSIKQTT